MTKVKISKTANNIMWVEAWIKQAHPSLDFEISAKPFKSRWICEFNIPTVNKSVKSISTTEVNAMLNAAKQARKLINEYLNNHPELKDIVDKYWAKGWVIEEDENGNFMSLGRSQKSIKSDNDKFAQSITSLGKIIETAMNKIERLFDYRGSLNIQVIDKKLLNGNSNLREIEEKAWDNYRKTYCMDDNVARWQTTHVTDDSVILVRYQDKVIDLKEVN